MLGRFRTAYPAYIRAVDNLRLFFAYTASVWNLPQFQFCDFAVRCKGCGETIPAPVGTMPDSWIVADCPLCGTKRRYLPTEIFRGMLSHLLFIMSTTRRSALG